MGEEIILRLIEALECEIQAIKKRGATSSIEVLGGQCKGQCDNNHIYVFPVSNDVYVRDDSPIKVVVGQQESNGMVVSLGEGILTIASERDFGPTIAHARIVIDDSFLVLRLRERLEEVRSGDLNFNSVLAEKTLGNQTSSSATVAVEPRVYSGDPALNEEQAQAVAKALGSEVLFLWGPPGTGKTTVLARIAESYYYAGLSVLVISNTNIAVDTALEMIAGRLKTDPGFQEGAVLRYGPLTKEELARDYGDRVEPDKVAARLGENLHTEMLRLESEKTRLERTRHPLQETANKWEALFEGESRLKHLQSSLRDFSERRRCASTEVSTLRTQKCSLEANLAKAQTMGGLRRLISGLNPERLQRNLTGIEQKLVGQTTALGELDSEIEKSKGQVSQIENTLRNLREGTASLMSYDECKGKLEEVDVRISQISKRIQEIQQSLSELRERILRECRILATTVYRTYLKGQVTRTFDAIIIDEASMLALPMTYYGAGLATKHVVVAGDFRQLPPIIVSDDDLANAWLKRDVFRTAGIAEAVKRGARPENLVALKEQHRMCEEICNVISDFFYQDHRLTTKLGWREPVRYPVQFAGSPFLYVNTASYHPWTSLKVGTYSRYNLFHAILLRNIVSYLQRQKCEAEVGVVSPYAAQTKLIGRLLEEQLGNQPLAVASTVHRFQGNEKDLMLIDLTDSTGAKPSRFIKAMERDEDGARLLNVALSRARERIVLIANFDYMSQPSLSRTIVRQVLDVFIQEGEKLDVGSLLPLGIDEWINGLRSLDTPRLDYDESAAGVFSEGTFFEAFRRDLMNAKESIVIFTPYMTVNGGSRWMDVLAMKAQHGIPVRVVTRPPFDQGGVLTEEAETFLSGIADTDVVLDMRARMHEKLAIIDNDVLWVGSLNIFSHRSTSEIMLRIPTRSGCEQMAEFVTSARNNHREREGEVVKLTDKENPLCPDCSAPMVWKNGRYGVYFECYRCGHKLDPRRKKRCKKKPRQTKERAGKCPECGRAMRQRNGRYGPFLGCSGYPQCKHTESL